MWNSATQEYIFKGELLNTHKTYCSKIKNMMMWQIKMTFVRKSFQRCRMEDLDIFSYGFALFMGITMGLYHIRWIREERLLFILVFIVNCVLDSFRN